MKTSAFTTLLFLAFNLIFVNLAKSYECRENVLKLNPELTASQLIKQDLTSGIWTYTDKNEELKTVEFQYYGLAEILTKGKDAKIEYSDYMWRVDEYDGAGFLVLTEKDMKLEHLFRVTQTCSGIILKDLSTGEVIELNYTERAEVGALEYLKNNLYGDWTNITNPLDDSKLTGSTMPDYTDGLFLKYTFEADQTFTCSYGNNNHWNQETGLWKLSPDGQYLILYIRAEGTKDKFSDLRVAKLQQVDAHILYLEHETLSREMLGFKDMPGKGMGFIK